MRTQHPFTRIYRIRDTRNREYLRNDGTGTTTWLTYDGAERSLNSLIRSEYTHYFEIVTFEVKEIPDEQARTDEPTH